MAACGDPAAPPPVGGTPPQEQPTLPPLETRDWVLYEVNDRNVPTVAALDTVRANVEITVADSSVLRVRRDGSWTQTHYARLLRNDTLLTALVLPDDGRWTASADGYRFVSTQTGRSIDIAVSATRLITTERIGLLTSTRRATATWVPVDAVPAPSPLVGSWQADSVKGLVIPAVISTGPDDPGFEWQVQVDTSRFVMAPNGRYRKEMWMSDWRASVAGRTLVRRFRFIDEGTSVGAGASAQMTSAWIQNYRFDGTRVAATRLRMQHPVYAGDQPVNFSYQPRR
jgi:hypothetical protein